ncbi:uncharacterized protein A4U43_C10F8420 [Asparagus officinalis]|uniref:AB hydrolase-1 domain-containing protein n=1 Tax=Asparagus officinalis TaxID=4686 RepID=A0A5P1E1W7_ASPOF|nr:uncharacterized protein LOC109825322 [Asparagus officinalis]ONK56419.1 uncharacterized protein A4U43_C10F8420 [Asparagus officinalis]
MAAENSAINKKSSSSSGKGARLSLILALVIGFGSWPFYVAIQPEKPKLCGSDGGPPVTSSRIRLRDGRFLAYSESGVDKELAKYKIVFCHAFASSRLHGLQPSPDLVEELGVYMVGYDRAGYGESDPNPRRSPKSEALDIQELADALKLGSRFYLIGISLGGHAVWGSIKYIPGRLAGAALLAPVVNYRWPGFPKNLITEAYNKQHLGDQWALRIAYYAPWLFNWWMNQSWLPTSTVISGKVHLPNRWDSQVRDQALSNGMAQKRFQLATQQGIHESCYRDMMVTFGKWEFDPMDLLEPPFPVHLWQGDEDGLVPVTLQRFIASRLKWIEYHELSMTGHYLPTVPGLGDVVLKTLLVSS